MTLTEANSCTVNVSSEDMWHGPAGTTYNQEQDVPFEALCYFCMKMFAIQR